MKLCCLHYVTCPISDCPHHGPHEPLDGPDGRSCAVASVPCHGPASASACVEVGEGFSRTDAEAIRLICGTLPRLADALRRGEEVSIGGHVIEPAGFASGEFVTIKAVEEER